MSTPEEEDRSLERTLKLFAGLCGAEGEKIPKIPFAIREEAGLAWQKLRWLLSNPDKPFAERDTIMRECRNFLYSLMNSSKTAGIPSKIRKEAYIVGKHFPIMTRNR